MQILWEEKNADYDGHFDLNLNLFILNFHLFSIFNSISFKISIQLIVHKSTSKFKRGNFFNFC
jgi:hypothetical protein